jgi:hypothetical protein
MKLKDILTEIQLEKNKWEIIPHNEIDQYEQRLYDLIHRTYSPIGGHPKFRTPADIKNPKTDFDVVDVNGDAQPDATLASKETPAGTKLVAMATDGSRDAVHDIIRHKVELLNQIGYFSEVSGKAKDVMFKNHVPIVMDKAVVEKVLSGKKIEWHGDGSYTREIAGTYYTKVMVGKPKV